MNDTDKGLPEPWQCETAMCPNLYTADQMRAMYEKGKQDALSAASGKAVAEISGNPFSRRGFAQWVRTNEILATGTKLYLHPATVTDDDVTQIIRLARRHEGHDPQLRAALSSFANKENRND